MENQTTQKQLKENQFLFDGKVVTVQLFKNEAQTKQNPWVFGEVSMQHVQELNPELFTKIDTAVEDFRVELEQILKERQVAAKKVQIEVKKKEVQAFKTQLETEAPELIKLNPRFVEVTDRNYWNVKEVRFEAGNKTVELIYDGEVTSPREWHKHKTDKPWVVNADYHRTRYGSLKKASAKIVELLNSYTLIEKGKTETQNTYLTFAKAVGLPLSEGWKQYGRLYSEGYKTFNLVTENIKMTLSIYSKGVTVTSVEITVPNKIPIRIFGTVATTVQIQGLDLKTPEEIKAFIAQVNSALKVY